MLIDQLDFINPDHVTVCCKNDRLTIYISNNNSSVRLTYALQTEDSCSLPASPTAGVVTTSVVQKCQGGI